MLRLLQSIFGSGDTQDGIPEEIVRKAIERAVDGTDPWLRAVSGYKKKLRPSVLRAIEYVVALVDRLPPPIDVGPRSFGDDPRLKCFFISAAEVRQIFAHDRGLAEFRRGPEKDAPRVFALLLMEKRENISLGVELSGDIVTRDVPQTTVGFESHRLLEPAGNEEATRLRLKRRAFDYLVSVALQRVSRAKTERRDLERRRDLLQSKLDLVRRGGWGFDDTSSAGGEDIRGLEENLGCIQAELLALGGDDSMLDTYLDLVIDVLARPGEHLRGGRETLTVDRMGIKRSPGTSGVTELELDMLFDADGLSRVVQLVAIPGEELRDPG